jgi:hypothetical protein
MPGFLETEAGYSLFGGGLATGVSRWLILWVEVFIRGMA